MNKCSIHNITTCFGNVCRECNPSAIIRTVDPCETINVNVPTECHVMMVISQGKIVFDRIGLIRKGENRYNHLFRGGMVGCGADEYPTVYGPKNIIRKIESVNNEVRFEIDPPSNTSYVAPYLNDNIDEILRGINSSAEISNHDNYKTNISMFCKYYKNNIDREIEFGGVYYNTPYIKIPAYSDSLNREVLEALIEELANVQTDQCAMMEGSSWVYLGTEKIVFTFIKTTGRVIMPINDYVPYPHYKRGAAKIINPNYRYKARNANIIENGECVLWALKAHKMISTQEDVNKKKEDIDYLT